MSDPRESPEWAEYERRIANYHEAVNNWSVGEGTESQIDHTRDDLDAFVLRLLAERREPVGYAEIESTEWTGREYLTRLQWVTLGIPVAMQFALHPVEP